MSPHDDFTVTITLSENRFEDTDAVGIASDRWQRLGDRIHETFNTRTAHTAVDYEDVLRLYKFRLHVEPVSIADAEMLEECVRDYLVPRWVDGVMMLSESRIDDEPSIETEGMG